MNSIPDPRRVKVGSAEDTLAVIPHLLGFTPEDSLVVLGIAGPRNQVSLTFRYDLPGPGDLELAADVAQHAVTVLGREKVTTVILVAYGPGRLAAPAVDAMQAAAKAVGIKVHDAVRVESGRYWSYTCTEPCRCPAEGVPFDAPSHPAGLAYRVASGQRVLASRAELAATVAAVTGKEAAAMRKATQASEQDAARLLARSRGRQALKVAGRCAVRCAIEAYVENGEPYAAEQFAWLSVLLQHLPVRDDAWAQMLPENRDAHLRMWTDVTRHAQRGYVAAPASLLAFVAWQCGEGALANVALDRALADVPSYSMALLVSDAVRAGLPPSKAILPMSPEQVAASYDH